MFMCNPMNDLSPYPDKPLFRGRVSTRRSMRRWCSHWMRRAPRTTFDDEHLWSNHEEKPVMASNTSRLLAISIAATVIAACGGGSGGSTSSMLAPQNANVSLLVSDASTEDWSMIGVDILSIALVPQGGGANVTVYTAAMGAPPTNLAQLDAIAELIGSVPVPVGTYTEAILTISANPGDVTLTASADPEPGFAASPGASIPMNQIQIQHV